MSSLLPAPTWVRGAVNGDEAAQEALIRELGPRIYAMCRRLAVDPADADDAYQAIWEKVLKALPRFDPDGKAPVAHWVMTVARRALTDRARRRRTRREVGLDREPVGTAEGPEGRLSARQQQARLEAAIARLPAHQRDVIVLHHIHGVPLDQIAAEQGVAMGTLKSRLFRGRARLVEWLAETP